MGKVSDNTTFAALSLPGTHDSMSFQSYDIELAHCQSITLQGQLQSGIRALDIRCRHIDNACAIHHGPIYLDASLDDVFKTIQFFFLHHSKEAIFMRIKGDEEEPFNNTRTWDETLASYKLKYESFIWKGDIKSGTIPELKDIRGKIIIHDTTSSPWGNSFSVQDDFKVSTMWNLYDKWSQVKHQLQLSTATGQSDIGNTLFVNFLSGVSPFGLVNPWFVASGHTHSRVDSDFRKTGVSSATDLWPDFPRRDCTANSICSIFFKGINYLFYDHVKAAKKTSSTSQHLGIVYADFPGKDLIELIIQQNM
jgi:1-phosphatidylinositol phosphodiesterase